MRRRSGKPMLVTGAHRSGTTWVGKVLALSRDVGYVEEPFNPAFRRLRPGICKPIFPHWFMYITEENEAKFVEEIAAVLKFRFNLREQLRVLVKERRGFRTFARDYTGFALNRYVYRARPLLKDPIAIFSTEWLAKRFDMDVVVLIRHPAAFVSSIKRMQWAHDFSNFLEQRLLLRDYLHPFEEEIRRHVRNGGDFVDDAILLWNMFYSFIDKLRSRYPEYVYLKHEELSKAPEEEFRKLFRRLNIEYDREVEKAIGTYSSSGNPREAPKGVAHQLKRNSLANISNWKHRLSAEEVERVKEGTREVWPSFYDEAAWE